MLWAAVPGRSRARLCSALVRLLLGTQTKHRHHRDTVALTTPGTTKMNMVSTVWWPHCKSRAQNQQGRQREAVKGLWLLPSVPSADMYSASTAN